MPCPACERTRRLTALLASDEVDAALDMGLMAWAPCPGHGADYAQAEAIARMQARLRSAWAARGRYRQRQARLERRTAEREARRIAAIPANPVTPAHPVTPARPALPAAAAAVLARARARAAERSKP